MLLLLHPVEVIMSWCQNFFICGNKRFGLRIASWAFFTNHSTNTFHYWNCFICTKIMCILQKIIVLKMYIQRSHGAHKIAVACIQAFMPIFIDSNICSHSETSSLLTESFWGLHYSLYVIMWYCGVHMEPQEPGAHTFHKTKEQDPRKNGHIISYHNRNSKFREKKQPRVDGPKLVELTEVSAFWNLRWSWNWQKPPQATLNRYSMQKQTFGLHSDNKCTIWIILIPL